MSRKCQITRKKPLVGNKVSHANNRTKRRQYPNVQKKRIFVPELNQHVKVKLSTKALKTVTKHGLMPYLRKQGLELKDIL